jgi:hypothetical protein
MSGPEITPTPIEVNLNVEIDANGTINVLGTPAPVVNNVIVAGQMLPVRALYDASGFSRNSEGGAENGLFEFWEPSTDIGSRSATLAKVAGDFQLLTKKFVKDLQVVLENTFDCSAATPFDAPIYDGANASAYDTQADFGRVALSTYAHYLFGHMAATSAITNDQTFMNRMLSKNLAGDYTSSSAVYKYATASAVEGDASGVSWVSPTIGAASDADLARLLVGAILAKNDAAILAIVDQVIGQDASRARDQDNNELTPDVRQILKFIPGDVIYMRIKLVTPDVVVGAGQQVSEATLEAKYTETIFTLKITLTDDAGVAYPTQEA